mmetsp:Transcript_30101/g.115545  ORF Transcript_30101/g.115545 Transcript_30101/m.115545 type:complete len:140 (-) Transcript_30101:178-597(-)|eukprot:CAMPEP_0113970124 /NCGR_PEP_ID=MMETSP0011_2-20120614/10889_1 /TAXON_ID=101924 /ORGANISM="Rhodosorus marinus" /LENGTH=139 /DNA_ID=CAMNT_0000984239 /DNA_START=1564 /DNA_END=1983 /DNA_ORIENTATION=+ /assembly_acc=CAM_ASM_000156
MIGLLNVAAPCLIWSGVTIGVCVEAPAKFRAKTMTKAVGMDVGIQVFTAIGQTELVLNGVAIGLMALSFNPVPAGFLALATSLQLVLHFGLRPVLNERAEMVMQGKDLPKSRVHSAFGVLTLLKIGACLATAHTALLAG